MTTNGPFPSLHRVDLYASGQIILSAVTAEAPSISLDGIQFSTNDTQWIDLPLGPDWNDEPSNWGWQRPQYRVFQSRVDLRGLVNRVTSGVSSGDLIAKLPLAPAGDVSFPTIAQQSNFSHRVDIRSDGALLVHTTGADTRYVSLDGITFWNSSLGWQPLDLADNFASGPVQWARPQYLIVNDRIYLRGLLAKATGFCANDDLAATLPTGLSFCLCVSPEKEG